MPFVPPSRQPLRVVQPEPVEQKFLAMAGAMMHEQGRLFKPEPKGELETKVKEPA